MASQLIVLSGLHAGARCALQPGTCSIGSDVADAVILGDPGIGSGHLVIDVRDDVAEVEATRDGASLDGADLVAGERVTAALPFELAVAGVVLRLEARHQDGAPAAAAPSAALLSRVRPILRPTWRLPLLFGGMTLVGVLVPGVTSIASGGVGAVRPAVEMAAEPFAAAGFAAPGSAAAGPAVLPNPDVTPASYAIRPAAAPRAEDVQPASARAPVAGSSAGLATALQELQAELSARSLRGVDLTASGGAITARGRLDPRNESDWRSAQEWFDERYDRYGRQVALIDEVRFAAVPAAAVAVDAVWTGRNPNVVIKGQKFFEGATLPTGFRLERIAPGELHVERDGQRQILRF